MASLGFPPQRYPNPPPSNPWHQGPGQQPPSSTSSTITATPSSQHGIGSSTLLVRHLPEAIPVDVLSRLFSHYGASAVRHCTGARSRNCAFVDFQDEALALQALCQLDGLRFLGKVLSVVKASYSAGDNKDVKTNVEKAIPLTPSFKETLMSRYAVKGSDSCHLPAAAEPIAEKLGIDYPFPPQLEYAYPPPDGNILTNILNALIAVPLFYTQVLHLMNKMNIPAPFCMALPTPPLLAVAPDPPPPPPTIPPSQPPTYEKPNLASSESDESEMESSDEEIDNGALPAKKRIKREAIVGPAIDKDISHEAVGLKPVVLLPKEIPVIKKKNPVLQIKITPKWIQNDESVACISREPENLGGIKPYATAEEIERHKLPPHEILSLPMFKNYTAGDPAKVLYIKNLAKDVVVDDIYYIFGSVFGGILEAKSGLSVKLMQEGRMRGQAFVTFPTIELAHHALNLANGYVFKGKPMIIQFGRSSSKPS